MSKKRKYKRWTEHDIDVLRTWYGLIPNKDLAKKLNHTVSSVQTVASRLSLTRFKSEHGLKNTRLYRIWAGMKQRCNNPNASNYQHYGGRGIKLCPEWENDFKTFYTWATTKGGYKPGLTIERVNINDGYHKDNCTFIAMRHQARNKHTTKLDPNKVREIRRLHKEGNWTQKQLARRFNTDPSNISYVLRNKRWKDIK